MHQIVFPGQNDCIPVFEHGKEKNLMKKFRVKLLCVVLMVAVLCPCVASATAPKVEEEPKYYYVTETDPNFVDFHVSTGVNEHGDYIVDVFNSKGECIGNSSTPMYPDAEEITPQNNPFYYVTETDPDWGGEHRGYISPEQAQTQRTVIDIIRRGVNKAVDAAVKSHGLPAEGATIVNNVTEAITQAIADDLNKNVPGSISGSYIILVKNQIQYAVRMDTGARHIQHRWLIAQCNLYEDDIYNHLIHKYETKQSLH